MEKEVTPKDFLEMLDGMSPAQLAFMVKISERITKDHAFALRLKREEKIARTLFWRGNLEALQRWFDRRTLEVVQ